MDTDGSDSCDNLSNTGNKRKRKNPAPEKLELDAPDLQLEAENVDDDETLINAVATEDLYTVTDIVNGSHDYTNHYMDNDVTEDVPEQRAPIQTQVAMTTSIQTPEKRRRGRPRKDGLPIGSGRRIATGKPRGRPKGSTTNHVSASRGHLTVKLFTPGEKRTPHPKPVSPEEPLSLPLLPTPITSADNSEKKKRGRPKGAKDLKPRVRSVYRLSADGTLEPQPKPSLVPTPGKKIGRPPLKSKMEELFAENDGNIRKIDRLYDRMDKKDQIISLLKNIIKGSALDIPRDTQVQIQDLEESMSEPITSDKHDANSDSDSADSDSDSEAPQKRFVYVNADGTLRDPDRDRASQGFYNEGFYTEGFAIPINGNNDSSASPASAKGEQKEDGYMSGSQDGSGDSGLPVISSVTGANGSIIGSLVSV